MGLVLGHGQHELIDSLASGQLKKGRKALAQPWPTFKMAKEAFNPKVELNDGQAYW